MAALTEVFVVVKPDTDKFGPEVTRKLSTIDSKKAGSQVATRFGVGLNGAMGSIVSRSAGIFAAGFAAIKGAQVFGGFIKDAAESAKISRITANAIKATGGSAKITADQVGELATAISNKTAIDDEQVQTAANMLLTFKNIRNEAGKNNDIFNRATQAAADLSVQFGGIDGASKQLGKALNDPIKGISALSKAGVTFTEQQKKQIKTLTESGDVLGAQKIILKEIEGQVGGAAAAAADPIARLKVVAGNLGEEIGGFLLPTVSKFATFISDKAIPAISELFNFFKTGDFTKAFREAFHVEEDSGFVDVLYRVRDAAIAFIGFLKTDAFPAMRTLGGFLSKNKDLFVPLIAAIATLVAGLKVWVVVQAILNAELFANPIGLVVLALAALVGGLVYAYQHSEKFREICDTAFKVAAAAGKYMWEAVLKPMFSALAEAFKITWERAQFFAKILIAAFNALKGPAVTVFRFIVGRMLDFVDTLLTAAAKAFGWVPGIGPKLKTAAAEFGKFKTSVNNSLAGINDQVIRITPVVLSATGSKAAKSQAAESKKYGFTFARGGGVFGQGTATSDSIPAMLSNGEHVWTAKEVQKAGGHGAVEQMRQSVMKYAKGGGVEVDTRFPSMARPTANIAAAATAVARPVAQALVNVISSASNPGLSKVLSFVKSQVGKPYLWGGVGPGGYDCSGLVSAAINTAFGRNPHSRLGATGSMPWSMFAPGPGAFEVGWFKGNPGHTAATVNGVNIESSGGRGVHMGSGARGARNGLFTNRAHVKGFAGGGRVGDAPYDTLHNKKQLMKELGIDLFDQGGRWKSGTIAANMSGRTETVIPGDGAVELGPKSIEALADAIARRPTILDGRRVDAAMSRTALGGGYR